MVHTVVTVAMNGAVRRGGIEMLMSLGLMAPSAGPPWGGVLAERGGGDNATRPQRRLRKPRVFMVQPPRNEWIMPNSRGLRTRFRFTDSPESCVYNPLGFGRDYGHSLRGDGAGCIGKVADHPRRGRSAGECGAASGVRVSSNVGQRFCHGTSLSWNCAEAAAVLPCQEWLPLRILHATAGDEVAQ